MWLRFSLIDYLTFLSTTISALTISGEVADDSEMQKIAGIVSAFDLFGPPNCTAAYRNDTLVVDKLCANLNNGISDKENKVALYNVHPPIVQCSGQLIDIYWWNTSLSFDIKCIEQEASKWEPDTHNLITVEEYRNYKHHHHHHHHHHGGHSHHHHHHHGHFHPHHHHHIHPFHHVHVGISHYPVWTHVFYAHPYYFGTGFAIFTITMCLIILCIYIRISCCSHHLECHSVECVEPAPVVVMQGPPPRQIPYAEPQPHP